MGEVTENFCPSRKLKRFILIHMKMHLRNVPASNSVLLTFIKFCLLLLSLSLALSVLFVICLALLYPRFSLLCTFESSSLE